MSYKKVTELDVLKCFAETEVGMHGAIVVPKYVIASHLKTSMYQITKHVKSLKDKGLMKTDHFNPDPEYNCLESWGNTVTSKGHDFLNEIGYKTNFDKFKENNNENNKSM